MSGEIKVGDVVVLKSGGPEMTVCEIVEGDVVNAAWFPDYKSPASYGCFRLIALRKVDVDS